ncbi:DNA topoisomerase IB [Rhodobacteraceae bacterium]|nr:DNA topoisomerase IB [Paracoccaceae bacterium]
MIERANKSIIFFPDTEPGISRIRRGRGFSYLAADGTRIDDQQERKRLASMAVPPAYKNVWMCPFDEGHLRATGRDDRGRKQYLYHPDWRRLREEKKFDHLADVGAALPAMRRWIERHLGGEVGDRSTAIAAVMALIDRASLPPGDPRNTRENNSHGATTLRNDHIDFEGETIFLDYRAKGGEHVQKSLRGSRLAHVLEASRHLPGAELISWTDEQGNARIVRTEEINEVLSSFSDTDFTAKSLRTWNGTHAAFMAAIEAKAPTIADLSKAASQRLHNNPAIARSSYIHPSAIEICTWKNRALKDFRADIDLAPKAPYREGEIALLAFLEDKRCSRDI